MYRHLLARTTIAVVLTCVNTYAQDGGPPSTLSLPDAVQEALARNPELAALRRAADVAGVVPETERHLMPPMVETQIWGWPVTTLNPVRTEMYMFTGEQQLPGRGKRAARVTVAQRDADLARLEIAVRATALAAAVRDAYIDLAFTRDTFDVYARQSQLLEDLAETATARYAAGEGPQHHTVATVVELAALERQRIDADERARVAEARLNTLLGRPLDQPVGPLAPLSPAVPVDEAEGLALARHPEVAMTAAAIAREEAELARLRGERRPDYVIGGGYMLQPGEAGAWTARAGITWPNAPWARGRLNAEIDVQSKRVEAVAARTAVIESQLRQAVREALVRLTAAERQLRLIESTVTPQVEHAFELARLAYATGGGAFTEVLDARRLLLTTQLDYLAAQANVARARAALDAAAGAL